MFPHIVLIGVPALFALLGKRVKIKNQNYNMVLGSFFLIFILLVSCRGLYIGNDTPGYAALYERISNIPLKDVLKIDCEPAYLLLMKFVSFIGAGYQWLFAVVAVISILPIWAFYKKEDSSLFTIALFLGMSTYSMYFSGLRQVIAIAFVFSLFYFARNKKFVWFVLLVLIAFQFHKSAFILAFLYPLCNWRITFKWIWAIVPFIGIIFVFNGPIFTFLTWFIADMYSVETTSTGAYAILILMILLAVYSFIIPDESLLDDDTIAMRNILLLCVCLQCFAPVHVLAMRMNYYFLPFVPVLITRIANYSSDKNKKITRLSIVLMTVFFMTYFIYNLSQGGGLNIYPYVPFWGES